MLNFLLGILTSIALLMFASNIFTYGNFLTWLQSYIPLIQAIGSLAILASSFVALSMYKATTKRHIKEDKFKASDVFLIEAKSLLEKTYETFTANEEIAYPPAKNRALWLTVARMLVRYKDIKI